MGSEIPDNFQLRCLICFFTLPAAVPVWTIELGHFHVAAAVLQSPPQVALALIGSLKSSSTTQDSSL